MDCGCHSRSAFSFPNLYYQFKMPVKRLFEIRRHQNKLKTSAICSYFLHFWQFSTFIPVRKTPIPKITEIATFKSGRTDSLELPRRPPRIALDDPQSVRIGRSLISCIRLRPDPPHAQLHAATTLVRRRPESRLPPTSAEAAHWATARVLPLSSPRCPSAQSAVRRENQRQRLRQALDSRAAARPSVAQAHPPAGHAMATGEGWLAARRACLPRAHWVQRNFSAA